MTLHDVAEVSYDCQGLSYDLANTVMGTSLCISNQLDDSKMTVKLGTETFWLVN